MFNEFETADEFERGYNAARMGKVDHRHGRWWIDDNGAELCRPEVIKGITAFYRDASKALEKRNPAACAAQIEEWNEAFERAAIERHDDIH